MRRAKWEVAFTREALHDPNLRPAERAIIHALAGWADWRLRTNATKAQIAEASGMCERTAYDWLIRLRVKGYIRWETSRLKGKERNCYELLTPCGVRLMKIGKNGVRFSPATRENVPR